MKKADKSSFAGTTVDSEPKPMVIPSASLLPNPLLSEFRVMEFQTPKIVADYMASFIPDDCGTILEPTPGIGNLVKAVKQKGLVIAPQRFEDLPKGGKYDWVIMNPPFTPMAEGYRYLSSVMEMSDNIIALLPWFILINSEKRMNDIKSFGLVSVTYLPRKTFPGCRIQCCVLEMKKGFSIDTTLKHFSW